MKLCPYFLNIPSTFEKEFGTGDVRKNLLSEFVLHENWWSGSHNLLRDINKFISEFSITDPHIMH
jgi:hypothetical protein